MSFAPRGGVWSGAPRRGWAIAATAGVHALVLLAIMMPLRAATVPVPASRLVTFDSMVSAEPQTSPVSKPVQRRRVPPQPRLPDPLPPPLLDISVVTPKVAALLEQADAQGAAGSCDLTAPVQAALQSNMAVQRQLPEIPEERRSVANAIAIWNQDWVQPDAQLGAEVLDTIRNTVSETIVAASQACRLQPQGGPRLIYLPGSAEDKSGTTILALGSGAWTWQQIADTAQAHAAMPGSQVPLPNDPPVSPEHRQPLFQTAFLP